MELELRNGDYVSDGAGGLRRLEGDQALLQRVLFRLKAHRGSFPFWDGLGSRLWQLGCLPARERQAAAKQYVTEALAEETGLQGESTELTERGDGSGLLTVELTYQEEPLTVSLEIGE